MYALNDNDDFGDRPRPCPPRPCFEAIDKRGKVRGRYRFARLAIVEASENGWELQMSGYD